MKECPILFSGPMVRAILEGRKTQTRRIVTVRGEQPPAWATFASEGHSLMQDGKPRPVGSFFWSEDQQPGQPLKSLRRWPVLPEKHPMAGDWYWTPSPYGKIGDRMWVREPWRVGKPHDKIKPSEILDRVVVHGQGVTVLYEAGGWQSFGPPGRAEPIYPDDEPMPAWAGKYRPSMFMPRWASRISLEITGVRVERLQSISEADAHAEGAIYGPLLPMAWSKPNCESDDACMRSRFAVLWDALNAARGHGWDANPWVWVIEFRRIEL